MIPMNRENRHFNTVLAREVISVGVVLGLERAAWTLCAKYISVQNLRCFVVAECARLVFVEKIAA